ANQTFTVDAKSACQLLADGGTPATVNSASSCDDLTGDLGSGTPVTLTEIWVSANGTLYDPAFKPRTFKTGVDIASAVGCGSLSSPTCAST
ncbi:hypothetical protein ABTM14_19690, partial [Acinetobacter baumannii]